jgi:hypothetical protein
VGDEHDRAVDRVDHRGQLRGLVVGGAWIPRRLVGRAPPEEVEAHDVAAGQVRDEAVVEVAVVGEAVEEHDRRSGAGLLLDAEGVAAVGHGQGAGDGRRHGAIAPQVT